jgi:hypothetical protein
VGNFASTVHGRTRHASLLNDQYAADPCVMQRKGRRHRLTECVTRRHVGESRPNTAFSPVLRQWRGWKTRSSTPLLAVTPHLREASTDRRDASTRRCEARTPHEPRIDAGRGASGSGKALEMPSFATMPAGARGASVRGRWDASGQRPMRLRIAARVASERVARDSPDRPRRIASGNVKSTCSGVNAPSTCSGASPATRCSGESDPSSF